MQDTSPNYRQRVVRSGGWAAIVVAVVLLVGIAGLVTRSPALRLWLAVLIGINADVGGVSLGSLRVINPIDLAMLALSGVTYIAFWPGPGKPRKRWMSLAVLLPFAGIIILLVTQIAGRSGVMGGGLVLSALMVANRDSRRLGYL